MITKAFYREKNALQTQRYGISTCSDMISVRLVHTKTGSSGRKIGVLIIPFLFCDSPAKKWD